MREDVDEWGGGRGLGRTKELYHTMGFRVHGCAVGEHSAHAGRPQKRVQGGNVRGSNFPPLKYSSRYVEYGFRDTWCVGKDCYAMSYTLIPVGKIVVSERGYGIEFAPEYRRALQGLEGFSHLQVVWWFSECDTEENRRALVEEKPYRAGPEEIGVFATRSPRRPNPIAISVAEVTWIDLEAGFVGLAWVDAFEGTPVLDVKPYTPSADRVQSPRVPEWCREWPQSLEESGDFDWGSVFTF